MMLYRLMDGSSSLDARGAGVHTAYRNVHNLFFVLLSNIGFIQGCLVPPTSLFTHVALTSMGPSSCWNRQ